MPAATAETVADAADRLFTAIEKGDYRGGRPAVERRHRGVAGRRPPR